MAFFPLQSRQHLPDLNALSIDAIIIMASECSGKESDNVY